MCRLNGKFITIIFCERGFTIINKRNKVITAAGQWEWSSVSFWVKSKQKPWTIILLVYVGSVADLIGLTNTNDNRSRDRYNVELRFKVYYISARQTSTTITSTTRQPTTAASVRPTPCAYTGLFNATKRIYLKLTRHKHHLLNYSFYKDNNYIPASLYPRLPPLYMNYKLYRRWRYISHSAAYGHLKLLINECHHKIKTLSMELSHHMELLRNSCTQDEFLFYSTKLDFMALSLESLLANRRAKKTAPIRRIIHNNNTINSLVNPQVNSITNNNDTSSYVTHNISNSTESSNVTPTRKRSRRKTKPVNIQLDNSSVINLSSYSLSTDETSILARGLTFCPTPRHIDWSEVSADIYDFSRRMRLTEYFFDDNSNTSSANQDDTPFHNKSTWNPPPPPPPPPTENEHLTLF